jgi:alcohol dehydrogenase (NADP+)
LIIAEVAWLPSPEYPRVPKLFFLYSLLFFDSFLITWINLYFFYRTWQSPVGAVKAAVITAIKAGYRHIDCAAGYGNEHEVGEAFDELFASGIVKREEIFVTSKLWLSNCHPDLVEAALKKTLADLRLSYLDLYLIHWPFFITKDSVFPAPFENRLGYNKESYLAIWRELEKAVDAGLIKAIGTSNMSAKKLNDLLESARIPPSVNQVELHPFLASNELLAWCTKKGIALTGYSPLGSPDRPKRLMEDGDPAPLFDETILSIAKAHEKEPAQILIRWAVQRGTISIPKSITPARIEANGKIFDFSLTDDEMASIGKLNNNQRLIKGLPMVKENQPWVELWDLDFNYE